MLSFWLLCLGYGGIPVPAAIAGIVLAYRCRTPVRALLCGFVVAFAVTGVCVAATAFLLLGLSLERAMALIPLGLAPGLLAGVVGWAARRNIWWRRKALEFDPSLLFTQPARMPAGVLRQGSIDFTHVLTELGDAAREASLEMQAKREGGAVPGVAAVHHLASLDPPVYDDLGLGGPHNIDRYPPRPRSGLKTDGPKA